MFDNATHSSLLLQNWGFMFSWIQSPLVIERSPSPGKYQSPYPLTPLLRYLKWPSSSAKFILSRLASQKHRNCRLAFLDFDGWTTLEASELRFLECLGSLYASDRKVLRLICTVGIKRSDATIKPDKGECFDRIEPLICCWVDPGRTDVSTFSVTWSLTLFSEVAWKNSSSLKS